MTKTAPDSKVASLTHLPEIDGWRGLAISSVLFHHLFGEPIGAFHPAIFGFDLRFLYFGGWLGVDVFFILSGFVLFLPYAQRRRTMVAPSDWMGFYKRRAMRLLPTYYLVVVAEMVLTGRQPFDTPAHGLETIGLLTLTFPFIKAVFSPPSNWALWSIGVEILFSLIFPAICIAVRRFGAGRVLLLSIIACSVIRALAHRHDPTLITWPSEGLLIGRLDEFLWGVFLAELMCRGKLPDRPGLFAALGLPLVFGAMYGFDQIRGLAIPPAFYSVCVFAFDFGIFLLLSASLCKSRMFGGVLKIRFLRVAGMGCYSLYLWHMPLFSQLRLHIEPWNLPNLVMAFVYLGIAAGLTYRFIEFRSVSDWRTLFCLEPVKAPVALREPARPLG